MTFEKDVDENHLQLTKSETRSATARDCATKGSISTDMTATTCQVRVGVRVRPLTSKEQMMGGKGVVVCDPVAKTVQLSTLTNCKFTYDSVFDSNMPQVQLYQSVSTPLLNSFLDGYNATIIAYGQTGSGKTFTMGSEAHVDFDVTETAGLIPRFINELFVRLQTRKNSENSSGDFNFELQASFLEVYGEDVHDLLDKSRQSLPLRENESGGIVCTGLTAKKITTVQEALQVLHDGTMNRTTAATLMNLTSSRSHAVFTVVLTQQDTRRATANGQQGVALSSSSRFTFVDLAGSERMKKTGAEGERAREGIKINEGLLALGNVINALADDERLQDGKKAVHVPYRQSKLTRLLQDALGGNSQTLFLACISPADTNANETLSTLRYANRARNIKNAPTRNVDESALELQRLQAYSNLLETELIKLKYGTQLEQTGVTDLGQVNSDLMDRKDVVEYITNLKSFAQKQLGSIGSSTATGSQIYTPSVQFSSMIDPISILTSPKRPLLPSTRGNKIPRNTPSEKRQLRSSNENEEHSESLSPNNKSILEDYDPSLLGETNPDEEMAILDQLLDIQHHDQMFDNEKKRDSARLKQVDGELAEQEVLLLQLRKSLEVYHTMKVKYETLMIEVQQLETEKSQLAEKLKQATVDPSQGCSSSIKQEMEKVERCLARARTETRKHRDMYRKAEQEAQKCRTLERKIAELKTSRVALMKKQKETVARHREFTETKTREIMALKRKERKVEKYVSKLQQDVETHKRNLNKRHEYCNRLTEKLKQSEEHLLKLLNRRQRELRETTNKGNRSNRLNNDASSNGNKACAIKRENRNENLIHETDFASEDSQEVESVKFLLDRLINDRVAYTELKRQYDDCYVHYSDMMRSLLAAVKTLEQGKKDEADAFTIRDLEQQVEEFELKVEIAASELEKIQSGVAEYEKQHPDGIGIAIDMKSSVKEAIKDSGAPIVRTLLLDMIDQKSDVESQRKFLEAVLSRKESVIKSLELEIEEFNKCIDTLRSEVSKRQLMTSNNVDTIVELDRLESEKNALQQKGLEFQLKNEDLTKQIDLLTQERNNLIFSLAETNEKVAALELILKHHSVEAKSVPEEILTKMQSVWREIGCTPTATDRFQEEIENCLEHTCSRKLAEATEYKLTLERDIETSRKHVERINACLGIETNADDTMDMDTCSQAKPLLIQLKALQLEEDRLQPKLNDALKRREQIVQKAGDFATSLGIPEKDLDGSLQTVLKESLIDPNVNHEANLHIHLSEQFLVACENALTALRITKTQTLSRNQQYQQDCYNLICDMKLSPNEIIPLVQRQIKHRNVNLPSWWNSTIAQNVASIVTTQKGIVQVEQLLSHHLVAVHDCITRIANIRQQVSSKLRLLIERSQQTLLKAVDGEIEASEAYSSFHEALFQLPSLSKDRIQACINEIKMLNEGVHIMTQSEIEALTVVWEALFVSTSERGKFWGDIDKSLMDGTPRNGPFEDINKDECDEEWILFAMRDVSTIFQQLESRLLKLELIHQEVERLRNRQDVKSRIISLDSEICMINARLSEFEDTKCDKQRLITKKDTSSSLLKEERFRKQMQTKFTFKIEHLKELLRTWKSTECSSFDYELLSDEVRSLLSTTPRNDFMHLRTVKYQGSAAKNRGGRHGGVGIVGATSKGPFHNTIIDESSPPTPAKKHPLSSSLSTVSNFNSKKQNSHTNSNTVRTVGRNLRDIHGKDSRNNNRKNLEKISKNISRPSPSKLISDNTATKKRKSDEENNALMQTDSSNKTHLTSSSPNKKMRTNIWNDFVDNSRKPLSPVPTSFNQNIKSTTSNPINQQKHVVKKLVQKHHQQQNDSKPKKRLTLNPFGTVFADDNDGDDNHQHHSSSSLTLGTLYNNSNKENA